MADVSSLAPAALHYAEAMCPAGDQSCIARVGQAWERDVDQAFGAFANQPPSIMRYDILGRSGRKAGTLTYADGTVTLCYERSSAPASCGVVGQGIDGLQTAANMLAVQGFSLREPAAG